MKDGTSKEWNEIISGLKDLIKSRNEKFGLDALTERIDYEKAKKIDLRERLIMASALDEIADVLDRESRYFTEARVVVKSGKITKPKEVRDTGIYLPLGRIERDLTEAADAIRADAQTLRKLK
jgi:hypothetical protein